MRITEVTATPLASPLDEELRWGAMTVRTKGGIIVRIVTDEGYEGLGEAGFSAEYFPTVGPVINQQLAPILLGKDPRDASALWQQMLDATHMWGRRGIETYAVSGVDIALWDLLGKISNQPLYRLLGAAKSRARAYFGGAVAEAGGTDCGRSRAGAPRRLHGDQAAGNPGRHRDGKPGQSGAGCGRIRHGADGRREYVLRSPGCPPAGAGPGATWRQLAGRADPVPQPQPVRRGPHLAGAASVAHRLAGGESLFTRFEYINLVARRTFDVLQPDCTSVGGISEAKRVADLASAWNIECVPHIACSSGTGISLAVGLHLILACQNAPLVEVDAYGGTGWDGLLTAPLSARDGYLEATEAPGLGVELAPGALEKFAVGG